ncbi:hypothetical protein NH8B_0484 [Pseudogulbenkiania sp. NH8B]|uniref:hypothetical protein n=1 Tax=Pseudogulbenkiania sp. (strain NH8B) TaxID=748280 RepID=UPI000227945A|nr:hypothetical protein [Pseudogulbenkiania sp. NH8B]BAK75319.1 hypothetical protein NH8B_0484 [Pseudogulbenkiania sp. NH8B]
METIKAWILDYLQSEGVGDIEADKPLFEQIDSFSVVGFLLACDERFSSFASLPVESLGTLTVEEIARRIEAQQAPV